MSYGRQREEISISPLAAPLEEFVDHNEVTLEPPLS